MTLTTFSFKQIKQCTNVMEFQSLLLIWIPKVLDESVCTMLKVSGD